MKRIDKILVVCLITSAVWAYSCAFAYALTLI